jgi:hypothetical protein
MNDAPRTLSSNQEYVHTFEFEVGEGDFVHDMTARGASEEEAREHIKRRLESVGIGHRPIRLVGTKERVAVRTRSTVAA